MPLGQFLKVLFRSHCESNSDSFLCGNLLKVVFIIASVTFYYLAFSEFKEIRKITKYIKSVSPEEVGNKKKRKLKEKKTNDLYSFNVWDSFFLRPSRYVRCFLQ